MFSSVLYLSPTASRHDGLRDNYGRDSRPLRLQGRLQRARNHRHHERLERTATSLWSNISARSRLVYALIRSFGSSEKNHFLLGFLGLALIVVAKGKSH